MPPSGRSKKFLSAAAVLLFVLTFSTARLLLTLITPSTEPNFLDGCEHVFLDCGSNRGIQIRKLFQPDLFPRAPILARFRAAFGDDYLGREDAAVCAVGFEPKPAHSRELTALERHYEEDCGRRVKMFTRTAVVGAEKTTGSELWFQKSEDQFSVGGKIVKSTERTKDGVQIDSVRLARFVLEEVATRKRRGNGKVLVKLDVEGGEVEVVWDLLTSGAASHVDHVLVEWHAWSGQEDGERMDRFSEGVRKSAETLAYLSHALAGGVGDGHKCNFTSFDDETYSDHHINLRGC